MNNAPIQSTDLNITALLKLLLTSASLVTLLFIWGSHTDIYLADEGFLWYGAQRTALGEIPILDFWAYDPGRYYFSAALMNIMGDTGLITLRAAGSIFYSLSLFIVFITFRKFLQKQHIYFWILSTITLLLWVYPKFKVYDISVSMILICTFSYLIEKPTSKRYLITGVIVGLAAFMGRNHGIYALFAGLVTVCYINMNKNLRLTSPSLSVFYSSAGIILGYIPMLAIIMFAPGFYDAFIDSILLLFVNKSTNISLPVPWFKSGGLVGFFFVGIVAFGLLTLFRAFMVLKAGKPYSPLLLASGTLTLPYAHYAYSRADTSHLALGIFPFLMGAITWISFRKDGYKKLLITLLCLSSVIVMLKRHPAWGCNVRNKCVDVEVAGDIISIQKDEAKEIELLNHMVKNYAPNQRNFLALPSWAGAYAIYNRKSPMYSIYTTWPITEKNQYEEIERIRQANPGFVIIIKNPANKIIDTNFSATAPLVYNFITENYVRNHEIEVPSPMEIYIHPDYQ